MSQQDDIMDVLSLARSLNNEIQDFNRNAVVGDSRKLEVPIIDPRKALGNVMAPNVAPNIAPPVPMARTIDGVAVTAPLPLIPLPEGYKAPAQQPPPESTAGFKPPTTNQLEFAFPSTPVNEFLKTPIGKYLEENLTLINAKISIIDSKLTELLSRKRKKYERREQTPERFGVVESNTTDTKQV